MGGAMFDRLDTNKDGFVTQDEIKAMADARFKRADKNGDGVLDADEQAAMRPGAGGMRPGAQ